MTEKELRDILSVNIKRYRAYRKWSQEQLAEKIDISVPFLSDIENGRKWVSPATLVKFASALTIQPFELFMPEGTFPVNTAALLAKYTDEAIATITRSLKDMQTYYTA
jgi:transcriptional regulator with XRE-family HTH domain